jgi:outer membrane protein TolC
MKIILLAALAAIGSLALPPIGIAIAESRLSSVSFDEVLARALADSPEVKSIDRDLSVRLAEATDVRLLPNPELGASVGFPARPSGEADSSQVNVTISQPFRLSHLGLREAVSRLMESEAEIEKKLAILELSQKAYTSYGKLWAIQEEQRFLIERREQAKLLNSRIQVAISQGALNKGEAGLFESEYRKITAELIGIDADLSRERAGLLRVSLVPLEGRRLKSPEKILEQSLASLLAEATGGTLPVQERLALNTRVASEREKLARKDASPLISPQFLYNHTEDGGDFVGLGFQFELPFSNRNQAERIRRSGDLSAARANARYVTSDAFKEELRFHYEAIKALEAQASAYEKEVVPAIRSALRSYEEQFRSGGGTVLPIWQAQRELTEAQRISLALWVRTFSARSELSILLGKIL